MNERISIEQAIEARRIFRGDYSLEESNAMRGNEWVMAQSALCSWAEQNVETHAELVEALDYMMATRRNCDSEAGLVAENKARAALAKAKVEA